MEIGAEGCDFGERTFSGNRQRKAEVGKRGLSGLWKVKNLSECFEAKKMDSEEI